MEIDCIVFTLNPLRGKCFDMSEGDKEGMKKVEFRRKGKCKEWEKEK